MGVFFVTLFILVALIIPLDYWAKRHRNKIDREQIKKHIPWFYENIYGIVHMHASELLSSYHRGRRRGAYGELVDDSWEQEIAYFVKRILLRHMTRHTNLIEQHFLNFWVLSEEQFRKAAFAETEWITQKFKFSDFMTSGKQMPNEPRLVYAYRRTAYYACYQTDSFVPCENGFEHFCLQIELLCEQLFGTELYAPFAKMANTPEDYEYLVATVLQELGFNVRTTKLTGDQGADVLANKNGTSFAIQCKMYSKPVGNKAVQEANAGRDFYKCDYGVVVSNAGYTKSAKLAANACGVILLNDNQLEKLLDFTQRG